MAQPDIAGEKAALRRAARAVRAAQSVSPGAPGLRLAALLAGRTGAGRMLGGYWPLVHEADPRPAMAAHGGPLCLPVVEGPGRPLAFRRWQPGAPLRAGAFGVMEPEGAQPCTPEWLIVPLLAFDRRGVRLGYGGGFYDRTLAGLRARPGARVEAIGLAFAGQEVAEVPSEPTDLPLDMIVTEAEVILCR
ncbi:MAG: 5-formyltetrahydrofolate cyclo-ligase [Alkalilacustris sp.]